MIKKELLSTGSDWNFDLIQKFFHFQNAFIIQLRNGKCDNVKLFQGSNLAVQASRNGQH